MSNCLQCLIANRESHFANRKTFRSGRSTSVSYEPFHNRWRTFWSKCLTLTHRCYVCECSVSIVFRVSRCINYGVQCSMMRHPNMEYTFFNGRETIVPWPTQDLWALCWCMWQIHWCLYRCNRSEVGRWEVALEERYIAGAVTCSRFEVHCFRAGPGHFSFTGLFQIMKQFYWLPKVHPIEMMISQSLDMIAQ